MKGHDKKREHETTGGTFTSYCSNMRLIRENRLNDKVAICSIGAMYRVHARKTGGRLSLKVGTLIAPKLEVD